MTTEYDGRLGGIYFIVGSRDDVVWHIPTGTDLTGTEEYIDIYRVDWAGRQFIHNGGIVSGNALPHKGFELACQRGHYVILYDPRENKA